MTRVYFLIMCDFMIVLRVDFVNNTIGFIIRILIMLLYGMKMSKN